MNWTTEDKPRTKRIKRRTTPTETPEDMQKDLDRVLRLVAQTLLPFEEARKAVVEALRPSILERERAS